MLDQDWLRAKIKKVPALNYTAKCNVNTWILYYFPISQKQFSKLDTMYRQGEKDGVRSPEYGVRSLSIKCFFRHTDDSLIDSVFSTNMGA